MSRDHISLIRLVTAHKQARNLSIAYWQLHFKISGAIVIREIIQIRQKSWPFIAIKCMQPDYVPHLGDLVLFVSATYVFIVVITYYRHFLLV